MSELQPLLEFGLPIAILLWVIADNRIQRTEMQKRLDLAQETLLSILSRYLPTPAATTDPDA